MKTINTTKYRTNDLRKIFFKCVREVDRIEKPSKKFYRQPHYELYFKERHLNVESVGGRGSLYGAMMSIITPDHWNDEELPFHKKEQIARVIIHEYYHNLGYMDFDRHNYRYDTTKTWDVDWVAKYPVRLKVEKPKQKVDKQEIRYNRAKANLEKAKTRLKRAKTIMDKWSRKVKYYELAISKREDKEARVSQ